jgi:replicative DNA helicase
LKGSGSISRRADIVAMVHREQDENGFLQNRGRVFLAKVRSGSQVSVPVTFSPQRLRLDD